MRFRTTPFLAVLALTFLALDTPQSEAQNIRSRQPLQYGFRWLGQGWSAGYHHRNPGPNTDYYNPYTAHNSMLISQQPGYHSQNDQYNNQPLAPGVPYSVYAPTSGTPQMNWSGGHAQSIQPTFEASDDDQDDSEDADEEPSDDEPASSDDMPNVTSDPSEPGSIQSNDWADEEDADFEESSSDDAEASDDEAEADDTEATQAGYRRSVKSDDLDFGSFMTN